MPAIPGPASIAGLLAEELQALQTFVALLRREQALLTEGTVDTLPALAAEKSDLATTLGRILQAREQALKAAGLAGSRAGMEAWLDSSGASQRPAWQELLSLTAAARELNETNGRLINLRLQDNQQALAVLMAAANQAVTYGPDGQQRASGGGRSLGSA